MMSRFKRFFRPGKDSEGETETLHSFPINRYENVTNNRFTVSFPDEIDIPAWLVRSAEIPVLTIDGDGCRFRIVLTDLVVIDTDGSVHRYDIRRKIASVSRKP